MDVLTPTREAAPHQLRALVTVARAAEDGLGKPQRAVIDAAQRVVLRTDLRLDEQKTIAPSELANHVRDPADTRQLIRLMLLTSLALGSEFHQSMKRCLPTRPAARRDEVRIRPFLACMISSAGAG